MSGYPIGYENTLLDTQKMILENNISLWIQIAPFSSSGAFPSPPSSSTSKYCDVFPLKFFTSIEKNTSNDNIFHGLYFDKNQNVKEYYNFSYTLTGYSSQLENGTYKTIITSPSSFSEDICASDMKEVNTSSFIIQKVEHIWFYHWDDFSIPDQLYNDAINKITTRAAEFILNNKTIVVSCYSGRGRLVFLLLLFIYLIISTFHYFVIYLDLVHYQQLLVQKYINLKLLRK